MGRAIPPGRAFGERASAFRLSFACIRRKRGGWRRCCRRSSSRGSRTAFFVSTGREVHDTFYEAKWAIFLASIPTAPSR
jgi:hypothetical protein